jgi:hypothetical protein
MGRALPTTPTYRPTNDELPERHTSSHDGLVVPFVSETRRSQRPMSDAVPDGVDVCAATSRETSSGAASNAARHGRVMQFARIIVCPVRSMVAGP